jgi:predicted HicB family RNase H-like nuclease
LKRQTSIYLEEEIRKSIKLICIEKDISVNEWITQAIKEKMKRENEED